MLASLNFWTPVQYSNGRCHPAHFFCLIANPATLTSSNPRATTRPATKAPPRKAGGRGRRASTPFETNKPVGSTRADAVAEAAWAGAGGGWQAAVERTVEGLGYAVVEVEREGRGLLRVTIDRVPARAYADGGEAVTVDDCEAVTRQLRYVLEVEGCDYARLEVSSPGLDRPLRRAADYARFAGCEVEVTLREPLQGRRRFRGTLAAAADAAAPAAAADGERWRLLLPGGEQALDFALPEVREARLVPVVDFKGRRRAAAPPAVATGSDGGREE